LPAHERGKYQEVSAAARIYRRSAA
jgi:hypothetical protein